MSGNWTDVLAAGLVILGLLAEFNLMRIFLRDWRRHRTEEQKRAVRPGAGEAHAAGFAERPRTTAGSLGVFLGASAILSGPVLAQDSAAAQAPSGTQPAVEAAPKDGAIDDKPKSALSLQINLDYTTAYFYHGIIQEDTGLILQPAARLTINLLQEGDLKLDALLGTWNSFHGQKTGAQTSGDVSEYWYESDLIGGLVLTRGPVSLTATYTFLTSPSDAYETVQELDLTLAYDDSALLGAWALHPYVLLGIETGADGSDGASTRPGSYLELGVAPGFSLKAAGTTVAVSFPAAIGLSLHDYYENAAGRDDTFGFAQIGCKLSIPLPFNERYGLWTLNAGASVLFLGDHTRAYNGGDNVQPILGVGLQWNF